MTNEVEHCASRGCTREARVAIRTTRPSRPDIRITIFLDNRVAPKGAQRYCKTCGVELASDVIKTLADAD